MELYDPQTIRFIKKKYGFRFSKSLGQNFLVSRDAVDGIVEGAGIGPEDFVLEIGPGIGVLTQAACARAKLVKAVEIDRQLIEVLGFTLALEKNVEIVEGDVLKLDLKALIPEGTPRDRVKIIGNLPYYITTPILMKVLESDLPAASVTVMMQKEVAERIISPPGSRIYGALSVAVQYRAETTLVEEVPRDLFMPAPKVDSAVLRMDLLAEPKVRPVDEKLFFRVVRAGFSQRRKTLLNALSNGGFPKDEVREAMEAAGIEPNRRAETLGLEEFQALADQFAREA